MQMLLTSFLGDPHYPSLPHQRNGAAEG